MQEMELLVAWQNFYVIIGTAAAVLTGLMFVVIVLAGSVRQRLRLPPEGITYFNTPSVVYFGTTLLIAVALNAPWQAFWQLSLLLGAVGLAGMCYIVVVWRRMRHQTTYQPVLEDWLCYVILPWISYAAMLVTAILLTTNPFLALFIVATATILLIFVSIHNAWDSTTYITIQYILARSKNQTEAAIQESNEQREQA